MTFFSSLGKIILGIVIFGIIIGGSAVYLLYTYVNPQIDKLSTLDKINYQLEEQGQSPIAYNPLTGEMVRWDVRFIQTRKNIGYIMTLIIVGNARYWNESMYY